MCSKLDDSSKKLVRVLIDQIYVRYMDREFVEEDFEDFLLNHSQQVGQFEAANKYEVNFENVHRMIEDYLADLAFARVNNVIRDFLLTTWSYGCFKKSRIIRRYLREYIKYCKQEKVYMCTSHRKKVISFIDKYSAMYKNNKETNTVSNRDEPPVEKHQDLIIEQNAPISVEKIDFTPEQKSESDIVQTVADFQEEKEIVVETMSVSDNNDKEPDTEEYQILSQQDSVTDQTVPDFEEQKDLPTDQNFDSSEMDFNLAFVEEEKYFSVSQNFDLVIEQKMPEVEEKKDLKPTQNFNSVKSPKVPLPEKKSLFAKKEDYLSELKNLFQNGKLAGGMKKNLKVLRFLDEKNIPDEPKVKPNSSIANESVLSPICKEPLMSPALNEAPLSAALQLSPAFNHSQFSPTFAQSPIQSNPVHFLAEDFKPDELQELFNKMLNHPKIKDIFLNEAQKIFNKHQN